MTPRFARRFSLVTLLATAAALLTGPAWARCSQNLVQSEPGIRVASLDGFKLAADASPNRVVVTFVGHSSFQIDAAARCRRQQFAQPAMQAQLNAHHALQLLPAAC